METSDILVPIISLIISTVVTTTIGILIKKSFDKFFTKKQEEENRQKQRDEKLCEHEARQAREEIKKDIREAIEEAVEPIKQDLTIIKKGTQAGLRHDLVLLADEWIIKGYCPREVKVDFENLYNQYHQLGKNGVMDNTYQEILSLPETNPKRTTKSTSRKAKTTTTSNEIK